MKGNKWCVITIDGPAGSGKSTISRILAKKIGFFYLDTGAMYRAVALKTKEMGLSPQDVDEVARLCQNIKLTFDTATEPPRLIVDNRDVTPFIRTSEMDMLSSTISALPQVREAMLKLQRNIAKSHGKIVAEGRDMGTVVFPDACVKFFLTASANERARRRYFERVARGEKISLEDVQKELSKRDDQDQSRKIAPLKPAEDSVLIDSTELEIEGVVDKIMEVLERKNVLKGNVDKDLS